MSGRKTIPLFDLLSRTDPATSGLPRVGADRNGPRAQASGNTGTSKVPVPPRGTVPQRETKPVVRVELKPQATAAAPTDAATVQQALPQASASSVASAPAAASPQVARAGLLTAVSAGRTITLPALVPVIIIVAALTAIITTWIFAYHRGANDKSAELASQLPQSSRPTITEPGAQLQPNLVSQPDGSGTRTSAGNVGGQSTTGGQQATKPVASSTKPSPVKPSTSADFAASLAALQAAPPAAAAIMTSSGWKTAEVREVGFNYLNIATLKQGDAASAIVFLAQSGVEAFGVPLASAKGRANTTSPVTYRIFVLPGITSEQYRARQSVMTNLEASVARLGRQWSRDQKGASDFRSPQWTRFDDK